MKITRTKLIIMKTFTNKEKALQEGNSTTGSGNQGSGKQGMDQSRVFKFQGTRVKNVQVTTHWH